MTVHKLLRWMMKWRYQCLLLVRSGQLQKKKKKMRGPFDSGEVRELKGTSPVENRLSGRTGDVSGTEGMELDTPDEVADTSKTILDTETPKRANTSAWTLRLQDPSPASTVMSITPRAGGRARDSTSPTPTAFLTGDHEDTIHDVADVYKQEEGVHNDYDYNDYVDEWPNDQGWGDDAMMEWDAASARDDDVSSVDREEAGLSDDDWGRDDLLAWDDDDDDNNDDNDNENDNNDGEGNNDFEIMHQLDDESDDASDDENTEETEDEMHARGMPTYRDCTIKDLQVRTYVYKCAGD
jgi:hypothetical protein